eukprot:3969589-Pyramimonas_sp.AAC.1
MRDPKGNEPLLCARPVGVQAVEDDPSDASGLGPSAHDPVDWRCLELPVPLHGGTWAHCPQQDAARDGDRREDARHTSLPALAP